MLHRAIYACRSLRRCASARGPERAGFTLIELIFVLAIISIVMAIAAPEFSNFITGRNVSNATNKIVALARHGRAAAIAESRPYRLTVDPATGTFWLDAQSGADFKELGTDFGQHFKLPDGMKAVWEADPNAVPISPAQSGGTNGTIQLTQPAQMGQSGQSGQSGQAGQGIQGQLGQANQTGQSVQFFPDGRCEMMILRLTAKNGAKIELGTPSETEMWRVVTEGQP